MLAEATSRLERDPSVLLVVLVNVRHYISLAKPLLTENSTDMGAAAPSGVPQTAASGSSILRCLRAPLADCSEPRAYCKGGTAAGPSTPSRAPGERNVRTKREHFITNLVHHGANASNHPARLFRVMQDEGEQLKQPHVFIEKSFI